MFYQFKCQFLSFRSFENSIIRNAVHVFSQPIFHCINVLLNILGILLKYYIVLSHMYITKFISIKEDGYPKISSPY